MNQLTCSGIYSIQTVYYAFYIQLTHLIYTAIMWVDDMILILQMRKLSFWILSGQESSQDLTVRHFCLYCWHHHLGISSTYLHCWWLPSLRSAFLSVISSSDRYPLVVGNSHKKVIDRCTRVWPEKMKSGYLPAPGHCDEHGCPESNSSWLYTLELYVLRPWASIQKGR